MRSEDLYRPALIVIIILFIVTRFWGLGETCLWFDEVFSVHAAEHGWREMFTFLALDLIHPPLYYFLLKLWINAGGESVQWVRGFSVLFSIAALIPFGLICRQLSLGRVGTLVAMFLFAVNGAVLKYSQEARMYSMLMCCALFSVWLFLRWLRDKRSLIPLLVVNILLVGTHYFGWMVVGAELLAAAILDRPRLKQFSITVAASIAAFLPWMLTIWRSGSADALGQNIGWNHVPGFADVGAFVLATVEPFYFQRVSSDAVSDLRISIPLLLIFLAAAGLSLTAFTWRSLDRAKGVLIGVTVVPLVLSFVLSFVLPYSIWGIRHLVFVIPFVLILLASAIDSIKVNGAKAAAITLIFLFSGYAAVVRAARPTALYSWCAWEMILDEMPANQRPSEVAAFDDLTAYHLWFASKSLPKPPVIERVAGADGIVEDKAYFLPRGFSGVASTEFRDLSSNEFWAAIRADDEWNVTKPPVRGLLLKGYRATTRIVMHADDSEIYLIKLEK